MSFFTDALNPETIAAIRASVIANAQAAGLRVTNWVTGSTAQQILETVSQVTYAFTRVVPAVIRGFTNLDTSTDPGDVDPFDSGNAALDPSAGFLSALGSGQFGTTREGETFAEGFFSFTNAAPGAGGVARTFKPGALVLTWTGGAPPSPAPTYRNAEDASIYTNPDGSVTVAAGNTLVVPIAAEEVGTRSSAPSGVITLTTALVGVSGTNALAVLGTAREAADTYRARCRQAMARLSLGGPGDAYRYLAAKNLDGTPLVNGAGNPSAITRAQVTQDSSTGIVNAYFASASGAAIADDVTAANANIQLQATAVPDAITYTGAAATQTVVPVEGNAKVKLKAGVSGALAKAAIVAGLPLAFAQKPVGGDDQDAGGNGVLYTTDIRDMVHDAYPALYDIGITVPAGASTAIAVGHVAVVDTFLVSWTIVEVP